MAAPTGSAWSDADLLRLLALSDGGRSASEIARLMGRSRSAVLGMLKRLRDEYAASEAGAV